MAEANIYCDLAGIKTLIKLVGLAQPVSSCEMSLACDAGCYSCVTCSTGCTHGPNT